MNAPFKQAERLGRLTTVLGPDALVLLRFDGTDYMNELFEYRVEALAPSGDVDFDQLVGTHASVEIEGRTGPRVFDGIVTRTRWAGVGENGHRYDLVLRPWLWLAGRRKNQKIFHNKTVVQIVEQVLGEYASLGDPALEVKLGETYPVLEYTVQFRESDLDFVRRQLERHGISFHFRYSAGNHTMVLTDDVMSHESIGERPYKSYDGHHQAEGEHFWDWSPERNLTTGAIRLIDYNFKSPSAAMEVDRLGDAAYAMGQLESYEYPGDYLDQEGGRVLAKVRMKQERGQDRRNRATGDCVALGAGKVFSLTGDPAPGVGENYLCLKADYSFVSEAYGSGGPGSDGYAFTGNYLVMPETAPMTPMKRTPSPVVEGPQTAVVVGDGEIDCDSFGRILVRFHWDLEGAKSMRCRVAQNWAGNGLGGVVIPRIGMEVVVDFIDGSPDKPIVTGCVVNGTNGNIYGLPDSKTKSGFKTKTHEGSGFNELSFEDANGAEKIFMHAQKDMEEYIKDNQSTFVEGGNRSITVQTGDETKGVLSGNLTETIALTRASQANKIVESAVAGKGGPGVIAYNADNVITMSAVDLINAESKDKIDIAALNKMTQKSKAIDIEGGESIKLTVGNGKIEMTQSSIVISFGNTRISFDAETLDQVAAMIHLNKDG
ncbi:type VI secretion system Vgr family protein [Paracoccus zhejiangensis]|uniref:Type VI secretion system tip protein VgrG n=1 Tax=Paracoccus zhejiangensis TaxID=1077935 RepID=A0A2H5EZ89_9RHOB|nr:type VI secretion system tip protein TssI/VgrG [Paracoccus zhejiangensis]AUH64611.1 type VI secretion system tip protein VgrG [Paracoccus zhejiangensis]